MATRIMITATAMKAGVGGGYDADETVNNYFRMVFSQKAIFFEHRYL